MPRHRQRLCPHVAAGRHHLCLPAKTGSLHQRTRVSPELPLAVHRRLARAIVVAGFSHESPRNRGFETLWRQRLRAYGRPQLQLLALSPVPRHRAAASLRYRRRNATQRTGWRTWTAGSDN